MNEKPEDNQSKACSGGNQDSAPYEDIDVPETIKRLAAAINDGAGSAQRVLVLFALLGLYLVATAFSTTDYDFLLGASKPIAQLDVQVPIVVSFAVAPVLFFLAHAFALTRFEFLARELSTFNGEVEDKIDEVMVKLKDKENADKQLKRAREHYKALLSNIEFLRIFLKRNAKKNERFVEHSGHLGAVLAWGLLIIFPFVTLYLTEISTLRLQNIWVTRLQQATFMADLMLIIWFLRCVRFVRESEEQRESEKQPQQPPDQGETSCRANAERSDRRSASGSAGWLPCLMHDYVEPYFYPTLVFGVLVFPMIWWAQIPAPPNQTAPFEQNSVENGRAIRDHSPRVPRFKWSYLWQEPLDLVLCPHAHWGCRYLDLNKRIIAAATVSAGASRPSESSATASDEQADAGQDGNAGSPSVLPADLSERTLRYADFDGATAPEAIFWDSDLRGATFDGAHMVGANFGQAQLQQAGLKGADMRRARFREANLKFANLTNADLQGAYMRKAILDYAQIFESNLDGADLRRAKLRAATMFGARLRLADLRDADLTFSFSAGADMSGADLRNTTLTGAYMLGAWLLGTDLRGAKLIGADLRNARLTAANLAGAELEGALLENAKLRTTDLSGARLFGVKSNANTDLSFADVGRLNTVDPLSSSEERRANKNLKKIKVYSDFEAVIEKRINAASEGPLRYSPVTMAFDRNSVFAETSSLDSFPPSREAVFESQAPCYGTWKDGSSRPDGHSSRSKRGSYRINSRKKEFDEYIFNDLVDDIIDGIPYATKYCGSRDRGGDDQLVGPVTARKALPKITFGPAPPRFPQHRLSLWVGLVRRALKEGSDDDRYRATAFACAAIVLMNKRNDDTNEPLRAQNANIETHIVVATGGAVVSSSNDMQTEALPKKTNRYWKLRKIDDLISTEEHSLSNQYVINWLDKELPTLGRECTKTDMRDFLISHKKPKDPRLSVRLWARSRYESWLWPMHSAATGNRRW